MQYVGDILVVDDDQPIVQLIAEVLTDEGYTVRTALNPADAHAAIADRYPDLILMDYHMPGQSGDALIHDLKANGLAAVPAILMTADVKAARELSMEGIAFCLLKPFDLNALIDCVTKHMRRDRAVA